MKKVLFLVNRDFVLYNFRFELAEQLIRKGYEVYISLPYGPKVDEMVEKGCRFYPVSIDKRGKNPIKDLKLMEEYRKLFSEISPDVVLSYTTKVNIYSGMIAGKMKIPYIMNISGLGTAVEPPGPLQKIVLQMYRQAAKNAHCLFFQNRNNWDFFEEKKICGKNRRLICGSGVNLQRWTVMDYPRDDTIEFLFIARIIKEKGIEEYLDVAERIKKEYSNTVFHVLGPCDGEYGRILEEKQKAGVIEYHGMVVDTRPFLEKAHCTIHPSYYPEGISNVLLETAACGRPAITTDRSGCKETVESGVTGYIVEAKNRQQLYESVIHFLKLSNEERKQMGLAARRKVEREFDRDTVVLAYMEEIENIINGL